MSDIRKEPLYVALARALSAYQRCKENPDKYADWAARYEERILRLVKNHMPHGAGVDSGTQIDLDVSTSEKLVFHTSFHHMNKTGMYDGWTDHTITVKPSLEFRFMLSISGRNRNQIKDYLYELFRDALQFEVDPYEGARDAVTP